MSKVVAVLNHWEVKILQRVYCHTKEYQKTNRIDYIFVHKIWQPSFTISYNIKTKDIYFKAKGREENKEDFLILSPNNSNLYYWIKQIYQEEFYVFH